VPVTRWHAERAWLGGDRVAGDVLIETRDDRITAVEPGRAAGPGARRLPGLVLPGLANAHSHAFHRALRGRTHGGRGDFWSWRERMYQVAARLEPDTYHALARATYAEMALAGVTAVGEFHYLHHPPGPAGGRYADPNAMGQALAAAAGDAGIRLTLLDTCSLQADVDGSPLQGPQLRFGDGDAGRWAERADRLAGSLGAGPLAAGSLGAGAGAGLGAEAGSLGAGPDAVRVGAVRVGAAIHSVRAVPPPAMAAVAAWAGARGAPLHLHLSEQPRENQACLAVTGRTPAGLCADTGVLGRGTTAVHATHLTGDDVGLLGGSGTGVCLCPTTERDLADGIGPAARLAAAGAPLCLGSDSHAVVDLFEEARAVELDERLATLRRGQHRPADLLAAATGQGMRAIGWEEAGALEPGRLADLVAVRLDSPRLAGAPAGDLLAAVVFAATAADVSHVVAGGRLLVADGRHTLVDDVPAALAGAIAAVTADG
jgi:cytosine/adenosine deaminase-related metal-dependent hydrolase